MTRLIHNRYHNRKYRVLNYPFSYRILINAAPTQMQIQYIVKRFPVLKLTIRWVRYFGLYRKCA